jgi:hypothetical protein
MMNFAVRISQLGFAKMRTVYFEAEKMISRGWFTWAIFAGIWILM